VPRLNTSCPSLRRSPTNAIWAGLHIRLRRTLGTGVTRAGEAVPLEPATPARLYFTAGVINVVVAGITALFFRRRNFSETGHSTLP
jgi:hypothetical protein